MSRRQSSCRRRSLRPSWPVTSARLSGCESSGVRRRSWTVLVAEISAEQVGRLLRATETAEEAATVARASRDALDEVLLSTAREAKVGLRELAAITGLHPNTIRAGIQRAAGEASIDFDQPELEIPGLPPAALSGVHAASFPKPPTTAPAPDRAGSAPTRTAPGRGAGIER